MNFKEIIQSLYTGKLKFVGDNKVYFLQQQDLDQKIFNKIKSKLKEEGFEISGVNGSFDYDEDRMHFPYIEVKQKQQENKRIMKKSEAKAFIREQILTSISEKKKKEEPEEEINTDSEETEPAPEVSVDGNLKVIQTALTKLQDASKTLGDEKLNTQVSNLITYFTRTHVSKGQ